MSRIGKQVIQIPSGVNVTFSERVLNVKGPKGELMQDILEGIGFNFENGYVQVQCLNETKQFRALHGLYRSLLNNMIIGVSKGFAKQLLMKGTGYRAKVQGNVLNIAIGYSHPVNMDIPNGIVCTVDDNTKINIAGIDKVQLGQFAANIRKVRAVEPYKGKGIMYSDEVVRRKEGKSAK